MAVRSADDFTIVEFSPGRRRFGGLRAVYVGLILSIFSLLYSTLSTEVAEATDLYIISGCGGGGAGVDGDGIGGGVSGNSGSGNDTDISYQFYTRGGNGGNSLGGGGGGAFLGLLPSDNTTALSGHDGGDGGDGGDGYWNTSVITHTEEELTLSNGIRSSDTNG
ncbi:MAG: hypothetical protein LBB12_03505, partial [Holosporaceae bacterium]|nr:hypothetical protein [Holosporaceae bacterium]